jgi:NTE family protein
VANLWRLNSSRYGRGEVLEARLDESLFHRATFAELAARKEGPFVIISAADLSNGGRFDFTQDYFDLLCSDLGAFPIARAVAASSSVPLVFAPITLWNYAGSCGYSPSKRLTAASDMSVPRHLGESRQQQRAREMAAYLDVKQKPYIHLVDGGVADNLAVRGLLEAADMSHDDDDPAKVKTPPHLRKFLFITVDAGTDATTPIGKSADTPGISDVIEAMTDISTQQFSTETRLLLQAAFEKWRSQAAQSGQSGDGLGLYMVEVSLRSIPSESERHRLMGLPTTLQLPASDVRALRETAGRLVRKSPDFQRLMQEIGARTPLQPVELEGNGKSSNSKSQQP